MHRNLRRALSLSAAAALAAAQCVSSGIAGTVAADTDASSFIYTIEGEDMTNDDGSAAQLWTSIYENQIPGYSGDGFVYLTGGTLSFTVDVPSDGMYDISVRGAQILNEEGRFQTVAVNGSEYSKTVAYCNTWTDIDFGFVRLNEGENTISFLNKYGYLAIDTVTVSEAEFPDLSIATGKCSDPDATKETQSLMAYLKSVYGTHIISGQQTIYGGGHAVQTTIRYDAAADKCVDSDGVEYSFTEEDKGEYNNETVVWHCTGADGQVYSYNTQNRNYTYNEYDREITYLEETVGDAPAIQGFDFGANCPCYQWDDGVVERMIDWTKNRGGICTASWHINVPTTLADYTLGEPLDFSKTTYSEKTDFSPSNAMKEGTVEYDYWQLCIKNLAEQLLRLQDAGVPLIFRPLHEADGNYSNGGTSWFWWGKEGPEVYNQLWKFLYNELTEKYGIHNIIWEQNLYAWSDTSVEWYSGDDYVDLVGYDKYNTQYNRHDGKTSGPNLDSESGIFWKLYNEIAGAKMITMAECDSLPSLDNLLIENAAWGYFCPWYDEESSPKFISGDDYQDKDELIKLYQSDYCITLSELPDDLFSNGGDITTDPTTQPSTLDGVVYGDANGDGEVTVADPTLIMQAAANPDDYAVKNENKVNADVSGGGDGVTTQDALIIQQYLNGKLDSLPTD